MGRVSSSSARQALENRVVLAVDRHDRGAGVASGVHQQLAGEHQRFLVGEQDALAGAHCGERGRQPGGTDDGKPLGQVLDVTQLLDRLARERLAERRAGDDFRKGLEQEQAPANRAGDTMAVVESASC